MSSTGGFIGEPFTSRIFLAFWPRFVLNHDGWACGWDHRRQRFIHGGRRITAQHFGKFLANPTSSGAPSLHVVPFATHASPFEILAYFLALIIPTRLFLASAFHWALAFTFVVYVTRILTPGVGSAFGIALVHGVDDFGVIKGESFPGVGTTDGELVVGILGQHSGSRHLVLGESVRSVMHDGTVVVRNPK